jgi:hypothetical protein
MGGERVVRYAGGRKGKDIGDGVLHEECGVERRESQPESGSQRNSF